MPPDAAEATPQASADDAALVAAKRAVLGFATMDAVAPALHGAAEAFTPTEWAVASLAMLDLAEREAGRDEGVTLKAVAQGTRLPNGEVLTANDVHNYLKRAKLKGSKRGRYRFPSVEALRLRAVALQTILKRAREDPRWAARRRRRTRQQRPLPAHAAHSTAVANA